MFGRGMRRFAATSLLVGGAALAVLLAGSCKGENRPSVEVIGGDGVVSISGAPEGDSPAPPAGRRFAYSAEPTIDLGAPLDLRALRSVINVAIDGRPVEWAKALDVYTSGRNQKRPDGTLRTLASLAADPRNSTIDGIIRDGLNGTGRAQGLSDDARRAIVDGGVQMLLATEARQSLDAARAQLDAKTPKANLPVDSAWGFIAGPLDGDDRPAGLLPAMFKLESDLKLQRKLEQPLELAFIDASVAAEKGDVGAFTKPAGDARAYLNAYFYLATLRATKAAEADTTEAARQTHIAEGWAAYQAIRTVVAGASSTAAQSIDGALTRSAAQAFPSSETQQLYAALNDNAVLQALGIPAPLQVKN